MMFHDGIKEFFKEFKMQEVKEGINENGKYEHNSDFENGLILSLICKDIGGRFDLSFGVKTDEGSAIPLLKITLNNEHLNAAFSGAYLYMLIKNEIRIDLD